MLPTVYAPTAICNHRNGAPVSPICEAARKQRCRGLPVEHMLPVTCPIASSPFATTLSSVVPLPCSDVRTLGYNMAVLATALQLC